MIDLADAQRQDPHFWRTKGEHLGRDGCRVPMPWRRSGVSLGFGPDSGKAPWLSQPKHWSAFSVESQVSDSTSTLSRVRAAIAVRRARQALLHGDFAWEESLCRDGIVAFRRSLRGEKTVLCVANMGAKPSPRVSGTLLCASGNVSDGVVPPDTTAWFEVA